MKDKSKIKSIFNLVVLVSITFFVLFLSLKDNFKEIMLQIITLNPGWFLISILLFISSVCVRSRSLFKIIKMFKKDYEFKDSLRLSFMTQFFNGITPFATGGQPFQIYHLKKTGVNITDSTNIIIQNFIVYQIALVFLGVLAVIFNGVFHIFKNNGILRDLTTLGFIINTCVVIGLLFLAFARKTNTKILKITLDILDKLHLIKDKDKKYESFLERLNRFYNGTKYLIKNKKTAIEAFSLNFLGLCLLYMVPLTVSYSLGYYNKFNLFDAITSSAYVMLIGSFVPIPGGTGGLEYGFTQFYGNFLSGAPLNATMLIWRFVTYYLGIIIGAIALYTKRKKN